MGRILACEVLVVRLALVWVSLSWKVLWASVLDWRGGVAGVVRRRFSWWGVGVWVCKLW